MKSILPIFLLLIGLIAFGRFSFRAEAISEAEYIAKQSEAGKNNDKLQRFIFDISDYGVFRDDSA